MRRAPAAALAVVALTAPAGAGAAVVVSPAAKVGSDATTPLIQLLPDGGSVLAWRGSTDGVYVARRSAGAAYGPAEKVAAGDAHMVAFDRGADGRLMLVWSLLGNPSVSADDQTQLALAPSGTAAFGVPEAVPVPAPPQGFYSQVTSATTLTDGTIVLGFRQGDPNGYGHAFSLERSPEGAYAAPKLLGDGVERGPKFTVAGDRVVAWWTGVPPNPPAHSGRRVWVADRTGTGAWTTPLAISTPDRDADNGVAEPSVLGIASGEMLAVWNSRAEPDHNGPGSAAFPDSVETARRPAAGAWAAPLPLSTPESQGMYPTASLSASGNGTVAWDSSLGIRSATATPGSPFSAPEMASTPAGSPGAMPIAVDDAGRSVLLRRIGGSFQGEHQLLVYGRDPGTCFTPQAVPASVVVNEIAIAGRADGTGTMAWSEPGDAGVHAAEYRQDPDVQAPECPPPPAPPSHAPTPSPTPAPEATPTPAPEATPAAAAAALRLTVGRVAKSVRAKDLIRRGLRVAVETGRAADVEVALFGEPVRAGGKPVVVAHSKLGSVAGKRVIRLKAKRGALARSSRRKALTLVVVARDGAAESVVRRPVRVRQG